MSDHPSGTAEPKERKKGLFALPPLSEIKKANKVSVIASTPTLFNSSRQSRPGHPTTNAVPTSQLSSEQCSAKARLRHSDNSGGQRCSSSSGERALKRVRDEVDTEAGDVHRPQKRTLNDRVIPKSRDSSHESSTSEAIVPDTSSGLGQVMYHLQSPAPSGTGSSGVGSSGMGPSGVEPSGMGSSVPALSGMGPSGMGSSVPALSGMGPSGMGSSVPALSGMGPSGMGSSGVEPSGMGSSVPALSRMGPSGMGSSAPAPSGMGSSAPALSGVGPSGMGPGGMGPKGAGTVAVSEGVATTSMSTVLPTAHHPHAIIANVVQKKNPVMKHIRNVPWELGDIVPDFVLGKTTCAMFLSVRYHSLHPNYIHTRLKELGRQYQLRILLVLVDMKECQKALQELAKIAILADLTLMLAWSYEEAGRYLETYKAFESKPPDILMERIDSDFLARATECLTTVKKVNKTDAATLLNNFKTLDKVVTASREELVLCPGLGPQKAQRLFTLFHQPFKTSKQSQE